MPHDPHNAHYQHSHPAAPAHPDREAAHRRVRGRTRAIWLGIVLLAGVLFALAGGAQGEASLAARAGGGLGMSSGGWVTTLFLEPITYESADYYYDEDNLLQYAGYIFHHGVDLSGGCFSGTYPVYAAADGMVVLAQYINDGYGTQVAIDHGYNIGGNRRYTYTFYGHMGNRSTGERYIVVTPGQIVRAGQLLGYQGNDGTAFGSCSPNPGTHLDWEVRVGNAPVAYGTTMRYNLIAASHNYYVNLQLTYGLPNPASRVSSGPFAPGGGPNPSPTPAPPPGTPTPGPCGMNFSDLPSNHWAYSYIGYLYCRGVVAGYGDGTFRPDDYYNRAEFAKMLALAQGWNLYNPFFPSFSDVPAGSPYYQYIETAKLRGVIGGYDDGTFKPDNRVLRAQATKALVLARGWALVNPPNPTFPDVPRDSWAYQYVETAARHGIVGAFGDGTFQPSREVTRAELAKTVALALQQP